MEGIEKMLVGLMVESSVETTKKLHEIISTYEAKGETVIPIEELKDCIRNGIKTATREDSLTSSLIKE